MSSIARFTLLALFAATLLPLPAPAAESYDSCTGFIDLRCSIVSTSLLPVVVT